MYLTVRIPKPLLQPLLKRYSTCTTKSFYTGLSVLFVPRSHQDAVFDRPDRHVAIAFPGRLSAFDNPAVEVFAVKDIDETILGRKASVSATPRRKAAVEVKIRKGFINGIPNRSIGKGLSKYKLVCAGPVVYSAGFKSIRSMPNI